MFRAALYREIGGYEPRLFIGGEETLVSLDVLASGHAIVYCEQSTLHHHPSPVRDSALRRRVLARNAAWVAWLRLPLGEALSATLRALDVFAREGTLMRDGTELLAGLAWTVRERRVVPRSILAMRDRVRAAERNLDASATTTVGGKFDAPI
ncbi:GT2 family glycosyltransferase [Paraburkholderia sp. CI3]